MMTAAHKQALEWLRKWGEDALFMRSTWNALADMGKIEFYGGVRDGGKGYGRLRIKDA